MLQPVLERKGKKPEAKQETEQTHSQQYKSINGKCLQMCATAISKRFSNASFHSTVYFIQWCKLHSCLFAYLHGHFPSLLFSFHLLSLSRCLFLPLSPDPYKPNNKSETTNKAICIFCILIKTIRVEHGFFFWTLWFANNFGSYVSVYSIKSCFIVLALYDTQVLRHWLIKTSTSQCLWIWELFAAMPLIPLNIIGTETNQRMWRTSMEIKTHGRYSAQKDQIWSEESKMQAQFSIRIIGTMICFYFLI